MGAEAKCTVYHDGKCSEGKALLEGEDLFFRGDFRLRIRFDSMTLCEATANGELSIRFPGGSAVFVLGPLAEKWAQKIKNPRTRLEKLGVKPKMRTALVGAVDDAELPAELEASGAVIVEEPRGGTDKKDRLDLIFYGVKTRADLGRLADLRAWLAPAGAIWVVRPKTKDLAETDIIEAAKPAGLVDVKVVALSKTHSALKLVIPLAQRPGKSG
jgi:hypothetical protein